MGNHYVCVTGGRDYFDRDTVHEILQVLKWFYGGDLRLLQGGQKGADRLARDVAEELEIVQREFPADWTAHGKAAGPIRNAAMATYLAMCRNKGHTVQVVAFPGGTGTRDMIAQAIQHQITVDQIP